MRILLISQMYPGPEDPDLGAFLVPLEQALGERGHEIERAVLTRRAGGKRRYLDLLRAAWAAAGNSRPDVVYTHFLVPTGLIGALVSRAPLVATAHGQDVANIASVPGIRAATALVVRHSTALVAVSHYLRRELEHEISSARGKVSVVDCGVDLDAFRGGDQEAARAELGWTGPTPLYLCVGTLSQRKNVVRLARAFERLGGGSLVFVGDGPLRPALEGRAGVTLAGRLSRDDVVRWMTACDVLCQPSLVEPFGQALLEAMACERSVVATRIGGPPEFVTGRAGALVDPHGEDSVLDGLRAAAGLPSPNPYARAAAAAHDVRVQAARIEEILAEAIRRRPR